MWPPADCATFFRYQTSCFCSLKLRVSWFLACFCIFLWNCFMFQLQNRVCLPNTKVGSKLGTFFLCFKQYKKSFFGLYKPIYCVFFRIWDKTKIKTGCCFGPPQSMPHFSDQISWFLIGKTMFFMILSMFLLFSCFFSCFSFKTGCVYQILRQLPSWVAFFKNLKSQKNLILF